MAAGKAVWRAAFAAVWGGFALLAAEPCGAQTPDRGELPEIIVTAQRREERPENVPISLTALSGDRLDKLQVTDTAGLGKAAPSLVMTRSGAFTQPFLRGVGKRSTLGVENSVATYLDGVYLASSISALMDLRGVERIEVLNGPQGALFGRNSTGGVIQVVTKDPGPGRTGEIVVDAGSNRYLRTDAFLSGGAHKLSGNTMLSVSRNGGYGVNQFTGKSDQGKTAHSLVARSKWIWRPAGSLKLTLAGDYQDLDQDFSHRPLPGYPPIGEPRVASFRDGDQNAPSRFHFRYGGVSFRAVADLAGTTFVSVTAQRWMDARYGQDLDLGPLALVSAAPIARQKQFSHEFQLQSGETKRLRWLAGLYYIHIRDQYDPTSFDYGGSYAARLGGRTGQVLESRGKVSSYAAYGQASAPLGRRTRLTAELRYTSERRSVHARGEQLYDTAPFVRPIPGLPLLSQTPFGNRKTFGELTWRGSLSRRLSSALMAYASFSRGFQSGGWNLQTPQSPAFGPETLDALESGFKFTGARNRISADASAFYYDYADMQVSAFTPLGSMTTNATSANIYGLDAQVNAKLGAATDVTMGVQVLRARFNDFRNATCTNFSPGAAVRYAPVICDATGARLPFSPTFKLNISASRRISLNELGVLILSGSAAYNSGYFSEPDNVMRQKAFATIDASVEWRRPNRGPSLRLWALNLTNSHHFDTLAVFPTVSVLYRPAAPRRFGVSAVYAF